jgi:hypothetical protein
MNKLTQTHDAEIFLAMVEILVSSGLGEKVTEDYGLRRQDKRYDQTPYEELASVMNDKGYYNREGKPLNRNALKQMVHRVRQKKDLMDELKPDWELFRGVEHTPDTQTDHNATQCLVCGVVVHRKDKKICSSDCVKVYQDHKDAPCAFFFPTIFHQMKYEETFSKLNHFKDDVGNMLVSLYYLYFITVSTTYTHYVGFRDWCIQPLCHLSIRVLLPPTIPTFKVRGSSYKYATPSASFGAVR